MGSPIIWKGLNAQLLCPGSLLDKDGNVIGGGASGNSFTNIQPTAGTTPVADSNTDTLTLTSSGGTMAITGNSATDTLNFDVVGATATEISYLSGVTSAIQTQFSGKVSTSRSISTTAPLTGGGNLSADRTFAIAKATAAVDGYLAAADFTTFNNKVSTSRSISTTSPLAGGGDLSADRTFSLNANGIDHTYLATSVEQYVDITPSSAQIKALNSSPLAVLGAPGAGLCYMVTRVYATATFVTTGYTSTGSLNICPTGFTGITLATLGTDFIPAAASLAKSGGATSNPILKPNVGISLFCGTGNPSGASADTVLKIRIFYTTLPFPLP